MEPETSSHSDPRFSVAQRIVWHFTYWRAERMQKRCQHTASLLDPKISATKRENEILRFQKKCAAQRATMRKANSENDCQSFINGLYKYIVAMVLDVRYPRYWERRRCGDSLKLKRK